MSYDYTLFMPPGPGPMASWEPRPPPSLGAVEDVKGRLAARFGPIRWDLFDETTWFGRVEDPPGGPEFQITPEAGEVRFVTMRRAERGQVEAACGALGAAGLDPQTMRLYSTATGAWTDER